MKDPVFVDRDSSVEDAAEKLAGAENTLMVRSDGETVGEVHESHLLKSLIPEELIDEEKVVGIIGFSFDQSYMAEKVDDVMKEHQISVKPSTQVGKIAYLMDKEDLRAIPVYEQEELVGVVHENQLMEEI